MPTFNNMQHKKLVNKVIAFWILMIVIVVGYFFVYKGDDFKYGLDLNGGISLTYIADLTKIKSTNSAANLAATAATSSIGTSSIISPKNLSKNTKNNSAQNLNTDLSEAMNGLRDIIEKRVNLFGVGEPIVRVDYSKFTGQHRLIVELPGISNIQEAIAKIGDTPLLEFKLVTIETDEKGATSTKLIETGINGNLLQKTILNFDQRTNKPMVVLNFNETGTKLFADLTEKNTGKQIAIYLDGQVISSPVVNEKIPNGQATISGAFKTEEAKLLVQRLNSGALPVPISLASSQVVEATLGAEAKAAGLKAGLTGFILIVIFMILWYRLPGLVAAVTIFSYSIIVLVIFKLFSITLTAAGIVGFIISIGIAIDANILIFERIKEEIKAGQNIIKAMEIGYDRAWTSIRDSNIASLIVALVLFYFGSSIISGFALAFAIGIVTSLFSAMFISKSFLKVILPESDSKIMKFLFSSGFSS